MNIEMAMIKLEEYFKTVTPQQFEKDLDDLNAQDYAYAPNDCQITMGGKVSAKKYSPKNKTYKTNYEHNMFFEVAS